MSRLRRSRDSSDQGALNEALETLTRDGPAPVTVKPLSDLTMAGARLLHARWAGWPESLRSEIVRQMSALAEDDLRLDFERALTVALSDTDPEVRAAVVQALWEVESTALLNELLRVLEQEPAAHVRRTLVEALGRYARISGEGRVDESSQASAEHALIDAAQHDPDEATRLEAMAAVAYLRPPEIEAQIQAAYDSGHNDAREAALRAMGRFGGHQWASRVIDALRAGDSDQRAEAARAAPYVEEQRVVPFLYEAAEDDESPELQLAALGALGEIGGREIRSFLEEVRDSTTGEVSQAAEDALANAALLDGVANDARG